MQILFTTFAVVRRTAGRLASWNVASGNTRSGASCKAMRARFISLVNPGLRTFAGDCRGNVAFLLAGAAPALAGAASVAVELAQVTATQSKLQAVADNAAIAAAREMRLGNATREAVLNVAQAVTNAGETSVGATITFDGDVPDARTWVSVKLTVPVKTSLASTLGLAKSAVSTEAKARVLGGSPVCAIALRTSKFPGITLDVSARMQANNCAVYSNSRYESSIWVRNNASLSAALICAGGGIGRGSVNLSPVPTTDCPELPDPLANRPPPPVGSCINGSTPTVISGESRTLAPGTYCGGLTITAGSEVTLMSGVYVIKDGPLVVGGGSSFKGVNVGIYFTGASADMNFPKESTISLTAPKTGPMVGILLYQDPKILDSQQATTSRLLAYIAEKNEDEALAFEPLKYEVSSDNASVLLGTIYLPKGRFYSGGSQPIAAESAYTIIVAYQINAESGPSLVLNSNYTLTDVPVPDGLGNLSNKVALEK